jgi:hypothetical protein
MEAMVGFLMKTNVIENFLQALGTTFICFGCTRISTWEGQRVTSGGHQLNC